MAISEQVPEQSRVSTRPTERRGNGSGATYAPGPIPAPGWHRIYRIPWVTRFLARHFHRSYYYRMADTILDTSWLGLPVLKCPLELLVCQ